MELAQKFHHFNAIYRWSDQKNLGLLLSMQSHFPRPLPQSPASSSTRPSADIPLYSPDAVDLSTGTNITLRKSRHGFGKPAREIEAVLFDDDTQDPCSASPPPASHEPLQDSNSHCSRGSAHVHVSPSIPLNMALPSDATCAGDGSPPELTFGSAPESSEGPYFEDCSFLNSTAFLELDPNNESCDEIQHDATALFDAPDTTENVPEIPTVLESDEDLLPSLAERFGFLAIRAPSTAPLKAPKPAASAAAPRGNSAPHRTPAKSAADSKRHFSQTKERLAHELFDRYNRTVFGAQLPPDMPIVWSNTLNRTAGRAQLKQAMGQYSAFIELSVKVVDRFERLESTLCHEMCHVAAWMLNHTAKPPHGPHFKMYAAKAMRLYPHLHISVCHDYAIEFKYVYKCSNAYCGREYGRHSKSVDLQSQVCGFCKSTLSLLPKRNVDGTPAKERQPSAFALFVKQQFAQVKAAHPQASQSELMSLLSKQFKLQKPDHDPVHK